MAQSVYTRRRLANALASQYAANQLVTIIDAQTGTLSGDLKRRLKCVLGETQGTVAATKFAAGATLTDPVEQKLSQIIGETATAEIVAAQDA
jgi:hypothetical protein